MNNSIKNETFYVNARVSKGCDPIIKLKFYSSLDYPFPDGNMVEDKCKLPTKESMEQFQIQSKTTNLSEAKSKSSGIHLKSIKGGFI